MENKNESIFGVKDINARASTFDHAGEIASYVVSMLSDVQEMIAMDRQEDARQALNRAKFLLSRIASDPRIA